MSSFQFRNGLVSELERILEPARIRKEIPRADLATQVGLDLYTFNRALRMEMVFPTETLTEICELLDLNYGIVSKVAYCGAMALLPKATPNEQSTVCE